MKLHNTLTGNIEEFQPISSGEVKMYHCGPTVYDYVHIGNLRAFLLADTLRRSFEYLGLKTTQVMNITDVGIGGNNDEGEDKIIRGLKREGKEVSMESMKELGDFYTERFKEDIARLNILTPHVLPKASEHIEEDISLIKTLEEKGFIYKTSDGIYFDTTKDPHYGKLGGLTDSAETRLDGGEKKNARDFALWKFNSNLGYPSPWGQGFPGWHIECSAMSTKYLGQPFDIHTGGIDLLPVHHNNEIAQSEAACGCEFAHTWLHNAFVNVSDGKMAKSEGNQITLKDVVEKGFSPLAYRYFLLQSHYRTPTTFSWEALEAAQTAYRKLKEIYHSYVLENLRIDERYKKEFDTALENDLNTPGALAVVWKLVRDEDISTGDKKATLQEFDKALGLDLEHNEFELGDVPEVVNELVVEREAARLAQNWSKSDTLREEIRKHGFDVLDTASGSELRKV